MVYYSIVFWHLTSLRFLKLIWDISFFLQNLLFMLGCCKFIDVSFYISVLIILIYFSWNTWIFAPTHSQVYLQCIFLSCFVFLFYLLLLQKYKLFSGWLSFIFSFHSISWICGRQRHYSAHILRDFTVLPFLQYFSDLHEVASIATFSGTCLGPPEPFHQ